VSGNLAIDLQRRRRTAARHLGEERISVGPDAERLDLHRALLALPRRQREVVLLRFVADQSEATVAAALGCPVGTVKSQASRGLAALRIALGKDLV
jgi:RNA polymerase sigma factor (sigma-70 family)